MVTIGCTYRDELDEICRALQQEGSSEALAFVRQLRTADRLP
jgi:hypothetical protein